MSENEKKAEEAVAAMFGVPYPRVKEIQDAMCEEMKSYEKGIGKTLPSPSDAIRSVLNSTEARLGELKSQERDFLNFSAGVNMVGFLDAIRMRHMMDHLPPQLKNIVDLFQQMRDMQ